MTLTVGTKPRVETERISLPALAVEFLKIGAAGFGGGMAIIALMESELVRKRRVIDADEFAHGVALGQILGPFSFNTALFTGYRLYGPLGGLLTAHAFMVPSVVLVLILSWLYFSYHAIPALQGAVAGLGPVVIALIFSAAWSMGRRVFQSWIAALLCVGATISGLYKINPVYVLLAAGALGLGLGRRIAPLNHSPRPAAEPSKSQSNNGLRAGGFVWPLSLPVTAGGARS